MTKATEYMGAAIDNAIARESAFYTKTKRIFVGHAAGSVETHIGKIMVQFSVIPQHMRKSWLLNGEAITASKLEKMLNA